MSHNFASSLQSNIGASLIYNLRTGNVIIDSLLSIMMTSLLFYIVSMVTSSGTSLRTGIKAAVSWWRGTKVYTARVECHRYLTPDRYKLSRGYVNQVEDKNSDDLICAIRKYLTDHYPTKVSTAKLCPALSRDDTNRYTSMKSKGYRTYMEDTSVTVPYRDTQMRIRYEKENIARGKDAIAMEEIAIMTIENDLSMALIEEWTRMCYDYWVEKMYKGHDVQQLYYNELRGFVNNLPVYNGYPFHSVKTFDHIFFDKKEEVLAILDQFERKTGIYAKKIMPYRLNILLHGIAGSGKTSLVKALANLTQRHVIYVKLPIIKTNRELMEVLHGENIRVKIERGNHRAVGRDDYSDDEDDDDHRQLSIPQRKRIYVLEDVDAMSDIVHDRAVPKPAPAVAKPPVFLLKMPKTKADDSSDEDEPQPEEDTTPKDRLNLSGLLNCFDGILELTDSILIMTTNHVDKLDPALIRPGRINIQLCMDKMSLASLRDMLQSFYFTPTPSPTSLSSPEQGFHLPTELATGPSGPTPQQPSSFPSISASSPVASPGARAASPEARAAFVLSTPPAGTPPAPSLAQSEGSERPVTVEELTAHGLRDRQHAPAKYEQVMMISPTLQDFYKNVAELDNPI